jgi:hypothetical protein
MDEHELEGRVALGSVVVMLYCIARVVLGLLGIV